MSLKLIRGFGSDHEVFECLQCGQEVDAVESIPALHRCESAPDYDQKCDTAESGPEMTTTSEDPKSLSELEMRETGVEPASPKAPDPKSDVPQVAEPSESDDEPPSATGQHRTAPGVTQSTTKNATDLAEPVRARRKGAVVDGFKADRVARRRDHCDSCRWHVPKGIDLLPERGRSTIELLHAHHVVPIACGGLDDDSNLVLLCPRCHALAHRLGTMGRLDGDAPRTWKGPASPNHLLFELALLRDPLAWSRYVAGGRNYAGEVDRELQQAAVARGDQRFTLERGASPI